MRFGPPIPLLSCLLLTGAGPSGGGQGLQPPTNFEYIDFDTSIDVQIEFTWDPPASGLSPEVYRLEFYTSYTGLMVYYITPPDTLYLQIQSLPYGLEWYADLFARSETLELDSAPVRISGITPEPPYP